jgi:hypothetical protein
VKKKRILLISLALLVFATTIFFALNREPQVHIYGDLSAIDQAEIMRLTRREMKRDYFPEFSWQNAGKIPNQLRFYTGLNIRELLVRDTNHVAVGIAKSHYDGESIRLFYHFRKETNHWRLQKNFYFY